jgi:hypothetical protein
MKRPIVPGLLQEIAHAPPVHRRQLDRQETVLVSPGERAASAPPPELLKPKSGSDGLPWQQGPREQAPGARLAALSAEEPRTVEAPAEYQSQIARPMANASHEEELASLKRRVQRLEKVLFAVLPNFLLIPQLSARQRELVAKGTQLLKKAIDEEGPATARAAATTPGKVGR